jgi:hypothetical protein
MHYTRYTVLQSSGHLLLISTYRPATTSYLALSILERKQLTFAYCCVPSPKEENPSSKGKEATLVVATMRVLPWKQQH